MKVDFEIVAHGSKEWHEAVKLREAILRAPLGAVFTDEELEEEKNHIQIVGTANDKLIATAVLVPEKDQLKMQRVVVLEKLRNLNIGSGMMEFCETYAKSKNYVSIYCHARDSAVNFYSRNGYIKKGDYFDEDGIPHLKMSKDI